MAETTRDCKYCSRSLGCDSYVEKQWNKPGAPCCIACAAERSAAGDGDAAASRAEPKPLANEPTALRAQVEFYLSDKNLRRDAFYRARIEASEGGWLPLAEILGAPRAAASGASAAELVGALAPSTSVELRIDAEIDADGGGCFVRRRGGRALPQLGGGGGGGAPASKKRRAISQPFAATAPTIAALVVDDAEAELRRKRAARFEAAAARPAPPPPQRSFAWSGGKMTTNREEATEAFLKRVSRGETAELSSQQRAAIARVAENEG